MAHERLRHSVPLLKKFAALWPAIGVIGPRQCGKTTLTTHQLGIENQVTLDDETVLDSALNSAKLFVQRLSPPILIDEVQKAPAIFDAIKLYIDRKRKPGQYFLTGSTQFSSRLGIRESLTGRIGVLNLYPLTLAETLELPLAPAKVIPIKSIPRVSIEKFSRAMERGGMPVPCFMRDSSARDLYWKSWLETTIYRDIPQLFKAKYDPRITTRILRIAAQAANQGELFSEAMMREVQSRTLSRYLQALEDVFVLRKLVCHHQGVGLPKWTVFDPGLLAHLMGGVIEEGQTLSLARTQIIHEISANHQYGGKSFELEYYKTSKGSFVDLVIHGIPIKIITSTRLSSLGWEERALAGAMRKLGSSIGLLAAPLEQSDVPKKGIGTVSWCSWS